MHGMVEALMELLSIPSVSGDKEKCGAALDYMIAKGDSFGFKCKTSNKGSIGIIEMGEGEETVGIFTHVDVADPCDLSLWNHDPFMPIVVAGKIYGRGAVDDKGATIAALFAMKDVWNMSIERGLVFKKKIQMIVGTSGETDWTDIKDYLMTNKKPDYGFVPDGYFPLCNIQKGCMDILLSHPLNGDERTIKDFSAGRAVNIIPDICRITLEDDRSFIARGQAGRSTYPNRGANAIFEMARALDSLSGQDRIKIAKDPVFKVITKYRRSFENSNGMMAGMPQSSRTYKSEHVGDNIYSPTMAYIKNGRFYINLNVRYTCDTTEESIVSAVEGLFADEGIIIEKIDSIPPMFLGRNKPYIRKFADAYESVTGLRNTFDVNEGSTYACLADDMVVWGPILPDHEDPCHKENEYISVRDLTIIESIYERALEQLAFDEEH